MENEKLKRRLVIRNPPTLAIGSAPVLSTSSHTRSLTCIASVVSLGDGQLG